MFNCKLCNATCYTTYICEDCSQISKFYEIYTKEVVLDGLKQLFTRNEEQRNHKVKHIVKTIPSKGHIKLKDREK